MSSESHREGRDKNLPHEEGLIERIARAIPSRGLHRGARLRLGIGDDSAILAPGRRREWVVSCDTSLEGVHFPKGGQPADSVGFKSLARATSDLAAMGAVPRFFLLTLAIPSARTGKWLEEFAQGMGRVARQLGMVLIGGDTTRSASIFISITVLGEIAPGTAVKRSGAKPGDIVYVSGRLGQAHLGLEFMKRWGGLAVKTGLYRRSALLRPHLYPRIRGELGAWLAREKIASAMMDISDGLSTDLTRLCAAGKVGARIRAERIPRVELPGAKARSGIFRRLAKLGLNPLEMALHGGDDYELLFTVAPGKAGRLRRAPGFRDIRAIGEIQRGKKITLVDADGRSTRLLPRGWDPFSRGK